LPAEAKTYPSNGSPTPIANGTSTAETGGAFDVLAITENSEAIAFRPSSDGVDGEEPKFSDILLITRSLACMP
jgi:hypothetical protein